MLVAAAVAAVAFSGDVLGAPRPGPMTEVVVTLRAPSMASFGRSLLSASHTTYLRRLESAQEATIRRVQSALPDAQVRWRYHLVADGFALVLPRSQVGRLRAVPGVAKIWPNVRYHSLAAAPGPGWQVIGADQLWGSTFATAGNGMKIGIIDDGLDAQHPFFDPSGFQYPPGFPRGQVQYATPKVIVQRTFAPAKPVWKYANVPFDPQYSFHATHVAGIAAGDHGADANGVSVSGVAPNAWLGNYKALTIPTPGFGLDGNSAEIAAAIEAAVGDGMNVINLSLGEPEIDPSRDIVVQAIDAAAQAGVIPVVAAGNDYDSFGAGSIGSPADAPDAITVAATTLGDQIADFSSAGPTPVSLQMKPDVSAPGVSILSSLPPSQGTWGLLDGTSMATPQVAGAAAILKERHPTWTVEQVKSALVLTGSPVQGPTGKEVPPTREGGGLIDLPKADVPLVFADPTSMTVPVLPATGAASATTTLSDAGGGAGTWQVSTSILQSEPGVTVTVPATVTVPGQLTVQATSASASTGDTSGFVVLTNGTNVRRIPFWVGVSAPVLPTEKQIALPGPGTYSGTTVGGPQRISSYRYPTGGDTTYPGPERAYSIRIAGTPANFGVAVLSGTAVPHVLIGANEDHLAGYTGLPVDVNPYRKQFGEPRRIAGDVLPTPGTYDIVFDTPAGARPGPFTFRLWIDDVRPPRLRVVSTRGAIEVAATDAGAGVDPDSISARLDGKLVPGRWRDGVVHIAATPGRHALVLSVADYQETKNMEDVAPILPNTTVLRTTVTVRRAGAR